MSHVRGPVYGPWPCVLVLAALAATSSDALAVSPRHAAPAKQVASAKKAAAPTDARRHGDAAYGRRHSATMFVRAKSRDVLEAAAGHGDSGGYPPLPSPPG